MNIENFWMSPTSNNSNSSFPGVSTPLYHPDEALLITQKTWSCEAQVPTPTPTGDNENSSPALVDPNAAIMEATFAPNIGFGSPLTQQSIQPFRRFLGPLGLMSISSMGSSFSAFSSPSSSIGSPLDPSIQPELVNVVSTVNLGCHINLKSVAQRALNAEYNPRRFSAVIMRIREPRTTCLIFANGKLVVTGAKSEGESRIAARRYARILQKMEYPVHFFNFKIHNMVLSCDLKFPIRLELLALAHRQFAAYEPELFPGLIYRMVKPKTVILIFVTGKIVVTGAKMRQELYNAYHNILPILMHYKRIEPSSR